MPTSNLFQRLLTAAVVTPLMLCVLFFTPPVVWFSLVFLAVAVISGELFTMTHAGDRLAQGAYVLAALAVSAAFYFAPSDPRLGPALLLGLPLFAIAVTLARVGELRTVGFRLAMGVFGPLWTGGMLTTVALLRRDLGDRGPYFVLLAMSFAWFGDALALFIGRAFGKAKLLPSVSPSKTWAGLGGAVLGAALGALWASFIHLPSLPLAHGLLLAALCGVGGQVGDLAESLVKRVSGAKDSGTLLPGHGGLLDRLDALMVVGSIVYLYTLLVR